MVHSTQSGALTQSGTLTSQESDYFWGPMQKGNIAKCEGNFVWSNVDQFVLHDNSQYFWSIDNNSSRVMVLFATPTFSAEHFTLPTKSIETDNFAAKARELVRLMGCLTSTILES